MSDFHGQSVDRKARKPHTCGTCYRRIDPGEVYHYGTQMFDGRWYDWAQCAHCLAIWHLYRPEDGDGMISEDGYDYWLSECPIRDRPEIDRIHELRHRVQFKKKWRRNDGALYPIPEKVKV